MAIRKACGNQTALCLAVPLVFLAACAASDPAGRLLAQEVVTSWREARRIKAHSGTLSSVCFSRDGKWLATGSYDKTARLWEVSSGKLLRSFAGLTAPVSSVALSPDGTLLAAGTQEPSIRLWRVSDGNLLQGPIDVGKLGESSGHVAFSPDGKVLATNADEDLVRLSRVADGQPLRTLRGHKRFVLDLAFTPDGKLLATGGGDGTVRIWSVSQGEPLQVLAGGARTLAFTRDGKLLASGADGGTICLWRTSDWNLVHRIWYGRPVCDLAFSPDGKLLAVCGSSDLMPTLSLSLWRVADGKQQQVLVREMVRASAVAFAPEGSLLAAGCTDGTIRLFRPGGPTPR